MRLDSNTLYHRDISTYCKEVQRQRRRGVQSKYLNKRIKNKKNINSWVERIMARIDWREEQAKWDL